MKVFSVFLPLVFLTVFVLGLTNRFRALLALTPGRQFKAEVCVCVFVRVCVFVCVCVFV